MALWIGLVLGWFVLALVGALALGRVLGGLDRPLRRVAGGTEAPATPDPTAASDATAGSRGVTGGSSTAARSARGRSRHHLRRRTTPAA